MKFSVLVVSAFSLVVVATSLISGANGAATTKGTLSCAFGINKNRGQEFVADIIWPYLDSFSNIEEDVIFTLFTKDNGKGERLWLNDVNGLLKTKFDSDRPTKFIIHGYWNSGTSPSCVLMRDAFLKTGDYNVIVVDWCKVQAWGWLIPCWVTAAPYGKVVAKVPQVTSLVSSMLEFLENNGLNLRTTTLIGHSLGAHIMGLASNRLKNKVNYIVGLDPALPSYENAGPGQRLSTEDANTVEVIHTNEGHCGYSAEIGHFDFYPNGGRKQPGCFTNPCAHGRAYEYYAESISSKPGFVGFKCSDFQEVKGGNCTGEIALMGGEKRWHTKRQGTLQDRGGIYHLSTNSKSPYAMGLH